MDHYLEISLRSDPEFPPQQLMPALYMKLHRALVVAGHGRIGVSFPDVSEGKQWLGDRLRLHAGHSDLIDLMQAGWLVGMRDHVVFEMPTPTPQRTQYRTVRRVQADSNPERMRRRLMNRHRIDADAARERIPDSAAAFLRLPFLQMYSSSTGRSFRLFIEHGALQPSQSVGLFSSYGLSPTTTIPWF